MKESQTIRKPAACALWAASNAAPMIRPEIPGTASIPCPESTAGIKAPKLAGLKPKGTTADANGKHVSRRCSL